MAGSWSSLETNLIVLVEESSGYSGIFGYSPAPGLNNLVFSIAAAPGTDPYGNVYVAGIGTYNGAVNTDHIDAVSGNARFGNAASSHFSFDVINSILYAANSSAQNVVQVDAARQAMFFYSGNPALGNLIVSLAAQAGTDAHGNAYPQGLNATTGTISGATIEGPNSIQNGQGSFYYSGTPALGNLIASIAATAGTDTFGNHYNAVFNAGNQQAAHFGVDSSGTVYIVNALNQNVIMLNPSKEAIFVYSGVPAVGNLIVSIAAVSGTDTVGNAYPQGLNVTTGTISGTTFKGTDSIINPAGIFLYSGTPATGNLIGSWVSTAGTDAFGNAYSAGLTVGNAAAAHFSLDPTSETMTAFDSTNTRNYLLDPTNSVMTVWDNTLPQVTRFDGNVIGWATVTTKGASPTGTQIGNQASIAGSPSFIGIGSGVGTTANTADPVQMGIQSGHTGVNSGNAFVPFVEVFDGLGTSMVDFRVSGAAVKTDLFSTPLTWQNPSYGTNWATSTTFNGLTGYEGLRFRLDAEDNVWIIGAFKAGAVAPSNPVFTLPAGYRPKAGAFPISILTNNAGTLTSGMAYVSTSGNLDIFSSAGCPIVANAEYLINGKVPIGNLG